MNLTKIHNKLAECLIIPNRILRDTAGAFHLRQWIRIEKENIVPIEDSMLPEILSIQADGFKHKNQEKIIRYSNSFRKTFYVIIEQDEVAGYCLYYLEPVFSFRGFEKQSVISEIAISRNFRGRSFAKELLKESIEEMKINGVSSILLYVNIKNQPAISLYEKFGFQKTKEVKNVCGPGETCFAMELRLV